MDFETYLREHRGAIERFVRFKISDPFDADDILQETYLAAAKHFDALKNKESFKPWILSIARNKCNDHFRKRSEIFEIPLDSLSEKVLLSSRAGVREVSVVRDTLSLLGERHKQILYLYFWKEVPQEDIAKMLNIPLGTVKSRLHEAKKKFKEQYPYPPKGETTMKNTKKLPSILPEYTIIPSEKEPFSVKWEEMMGWFIVPRLGEKLAWAMYDFPEKRRTEYTEMEVVGKAEIHGIEGVEITANEYNPMDCNQTDNKDLAERRFVAQLTDTHCRALAESHMQNGVRKCYTFLDGDAFLNNWGFGEDNRGNETDLSPKGLIVKRASAVTCPLEKELLDVVGRYTVTIDGKSYDTICVMDVSLYMEGMATEQYLDKNGRTILWRRFNRDDWAFDRYGQKWSEKLPENERITINGKTYVHWYDCITDYIL